MKAAENFDKIANDLAGRFNGGQEIPWLQLTEAIIWVFFLTTILNMIKRPAFISLTVCVLAFYVLHNTDKITRKTFRGFVLLIFASVLYDAVSIFLFEPSSASEDEEDGGQMWKIRRFTALMTMINLLLKIIVGLIFWKDSLDFRKIVKNKDFNEDDELNVIMAQYRQDI